MEHLLYMQGSKIILFTLFSTASLAVRWHFVYLHKYTGTALSKALCCRAISTPNITEPQNSPPSQTATPFPWPTRLTIARRNTSYFIPAYRMLHPHLSTHAEFYRAVSTGTWKTNIGSSHPGVNSRIFAESLGSGSGWVGWWVRKISEECPFNFQNLLVTLRQW